MLGVCDQKLRLTRHTFQELQEMKRFGMAIYVVKRSFNGILTLFHAIPVHVSVCVFCYLAYWVYRANV